jgi:hypothetical protein
VKANQYGEIQTPMRCSWIKKKKAGFNTCLFNNGSMKATCQDPEIASGLGRYLFDKANNTPDKHINCLIPRKLNINHKLLMPAFHLSKRKIELVQTIGVNSYWPNGLGPSKILQAGLMAWLSPPFFGMNARQFYGDPTDV